MKAMTRSARWSTELWAELYEDVDHLRQAVAGFTELYNTEWLIERLGHRSPREA